MNREQAIAAYRIELAELHWLSDLRTYYAKNKLRTNDFILMMNVLVHDQREAVAAARAAVAACSEVA